MGYCIFIGLDELQDRCLCMENLFKDGVFRFEKRFLFQDSDSDVIAENDRSGFGSVISGNDAEEGGFPHTVFGNQGHLLSFSDTE